jgi:hypothetical protein
MKVILHSDFECVFYINGVLREKGGWEIEDGVVYYVTILPLDALYMPYTVKLVGDKICSNRMLAVSVKTKRDTYLLFTKRYEYVFSPPSFGDKTSVAAKFFSLVKQAKFNDARALMTQSLSDSVSDEDLAGFFQDYDFIARLSGDEWLLASKTGEGEITSFALEGDKINDVFS